MAKTKYLFVCREGIKRSVVAAQVASEIANERDRNIAMAHAPVPSGNPNPLIERHLNGYAKVFVMESWMKRRINRQGYDGKVIVLGVGDHGYSADDPRLREIFRGKLERFV